MARRSLAALALAAALVMPAAAQAFCGFYVSGSSEQLTNKATRVAMMRDGTRTVLSMSNDYDGPAQDFAMVVPVPVVLQRENVRTLPHEIFTHLEALTAPRLVEYWEQDPCFVERESNTATRSGSRSVDDLLSRVGGGGNGHGVRVEAQFTVGEYEVVVLSATQSTGLELWLRENRYNIPQGAAEFMAPYVREQWKFLVARVDIERAQRRPNGGARLSPLRFHYDAPDFRLPVRLGLLNAGAAQDLLVYLLHPTSRFEVANYRNAFIPTNLDVANSARGNFGELYARLFDYTLDQAGGRAVVTEYAWSTSSCDPCPTPPLAQSDLVTLGADVLGQGRPGFDQSYHVYNMTVTRLHTRYDRATLTEDLVFREAAAVQGGREQFIDQRGRLEQGAQPALRRGNQFQARYAIRHPWTGPVRCAHPRRGFWGGPPNGTRPAPATARDLAEVRRGRVQLARAIRSPIPPITFSPTPVVPAATPAPTAPAPAAPPPPQRRSDNGPTRTGLLAGLAALVGLAFARRRG